MYSVILLATLSTAPEAVGGHRGLRGGCAGNQASSGCQGVSAGGSGLQGRSRERVRLFNRGGGCRSESAGCQGDRGGRFLFRQRTVQKGHSSAPIAAPAPASAKMPAKAANCPECPVTTNLTVLTPEDALAEVNRIRASQGLPALQHDPYLAAGAAQCAVHRAAFLCEGHTASDFGALPAGSPQCIGGAGVEYGSGFNACCVDESGWRYAGAAKCRGRDGRVYCQIFVR